MQDSRKLSKLPLRNDRGLPQEQLPQLQGNLDWRSPQSWCRAGGTAQHSFCCTCTRTRSYLLHTVHVVDATNNFAWPVIFKCILSWLIKLNVSLFYIVCGWRELNLAIWLQTGHSTQGIYWVCTRIFIRCKTAEKTTPLVSNTTTSNIPILVLRQLTYRHSEVLTLFTIAST